MYFSFRRDSFYGRIIIEINADSKCNLNKWVLNVPCKQAQKAGRGVRSPYGTVWHYNRDIVLELLPSTPQASSIDRDTIKERSFGP